MKFYLRITRQDSVEYQACAMTAEIAISKAKFAYLEPYTKMVEVVDTDTNEVVYSREKIL